MFFSNLKTKIENYWYHYKWHTIIIAGFAVIIAVLTAQLIQRDSFDAEIIYSGPSNVTPNQVSDIQSAFASVLPGDRDGDGKKNVQLYNFYLPTADEIKELEEKAAEDDLLYVPNNSQIAETRTQFTNQIYVGQALICLLDPEWYDLVLENKGFVPLDEIFEEAPEYALDECSVRLKDTPFGKYFASTFACLPDDTVLCFRRMSSTTALKIGRSEQERYDYNKELFKALFDFSIG